jgi:hypothetical protein
MRGITSRATGAPSEIERTLAPDASAREPSAARRASICAHWLRAASRAIAPRATEAPVPIRRAAPPTISAALARRRSSTRRPRPAGWVNVGDAARRPGAPLGAS